jgi:hypothetical protein
LGISTTGLKLCDQKSWLGMDQSGLSVVQPKNGKLTFFIIPYSIFIAFF